MTFLYLLSFCIAFCAALYAIKGGQHIGEHTRALLDRKTGVKGTLLRELADGKNLSSILFGIATLNFGAAIGWFVGCSPSLGEEVPAIGGIKGNWVHEKIDGVGVDRTLAGAEAKAARNSALKSAIQRGVFMGACVAVGMQDFNFLYAGATWPLCVFLGISISQVYRDVVNTGWRTYEIIYGVPFGIALFFHYIN